MHIFFTSPIPLLGTLKLNLTSVAFASNAFHMYSKRHSYGLLLYEANSVRSESSVSFNSSVVGIGFTPGNKFYFVLFEAFVFPKTIDVISDWRYSLSFSMALSTLEISFSIFLVSISRKDTICSCSGIDGQGTSNDLIFS